MQYLCKCEIFFYPYSHEAVCVKPARVARTPVRGACAHGPASVRGQRGVVTGKRRMLPPLVSVTALPKLRCGAVKPARAGEKAPSRPAIERRLQKARARRQHGAPQNGAATLHGPARRSRRHSRPRDDVDQVSPLPARRGHVAISQS